MPFSACTYPETGTWGGRGGGQGASNYKFGICGISHNCVAAVVRDITINYYWNDDTVPQNWEMGFNVYQWISNCPDAPTWDRKILYTGSFERDSGTGCGDSKDLNIIIPLDQRDICIYIEIELRAIHNGIPPLFRSQLVHKVGDKTGDRDSVIRICCNQPSACGIVKDLPSFCNA